VSGFGPEDPFEGIPFLNDLAKMLQSQSGAGGWESARQFAVQMFEEPGHHFFAG
jgi:hypothetical protein